MPLESTGPVEELAVPHDLIRKGNNYVLRVKGDSLECDNVSDGDFLIVNARTTPEPGETVIMARDGEAPVIAKYVGDGMFSFLPDGDEARSPWELSDGLSVHCILIGIIRKY